MPRGGPPKPISSIIDAARPSASPAESGLIDPTGAPLVSQPAASTRPPSAKAAALSNSGKRLASERTHRRAKTLDHLAVVGQDINTPPRPKDAIAYITTFLIHATLPYKDPGDVDLWERKSDKFTVAFERGYTAPDRQGARRLVGLPFGIYPRLIFSWLTSAAVETRSPDLPLGRSFTDWIRDGLHISPTGGERGTISLIREQMTRILAMKITVSTQQQVYHARKDQQLSASFQLVPVAGEAAFWDPEQPDAHNLKDPHLRLSLDYFKICLEKSAPFDERVQIELARTGSCMAIDLYRLLTYKQYAMQKAQTRTPEIVTYKQLAGMLGQANTRSDNFRKSAVENLELVVRLYPGCNTEARNAGFLIRPGAPHIPARPKRPLPSQLSLLGGPPEPITDTIPIPDLSAEGDQ